MPPEELLKSAVNMKSKQYKWESLAQDFNSPFLRNHIWISSLFFYKDLLDISGPAMCIASDKNYINYLSDKSAWKKAHNSAVKKIEKDYHWLRKAIDRTMAFGESFNNWTQKNIYDADLTKASNKKLINLLYGFATRQSKLYTLGVLLPILDFQGYSFVERNLEIILTAKVPAKNRKEYFRVLTEPIGFSFAQDQEAALLKLIARFYSKTRSKNILNSSLAEIEENDPKFYLALVKHAQKFGWTYYVYMGPAFDAGNFLEFVKDYLIKKSSPKKILADLLKKRKDTESLRKKYINSIKPTSFEKEVLLLAGKMVWAKPRRKDYQSKSYFHVEKLIREIGKRLGLSLDQALSAPFEAMAKALLEGKDIDIHLVNQVNELHVCVPNFNAKRVDVLYGKKAKSFFKKYIPAIKKASYKKEIKGSVAYKGTARGTVKIVNSPKDVHKMEHGDILVSVATTPAIVGAMKKASAIVADEGGLTCHAAIVSRELETPCVVGTKIATRVLQDGDIVEVDAIKGIIKKIK